MGPWASALIAVAALAAVFFAVMAFRGLVEAVEQFSGRCAECGRVTALPLPVDGHRCRRCRRHGHLHLPRARDRHAVG